MTMGSVHVVSVADCENVSKKREQVKQALYAIFDPKKSP